MINYITEYLINEEKLGTENIDKDRCSYAWENFYTPFYSNRDFWKNTNNF